MPCIIISSNCLLSVQFSLAWKLYGDKKSIVTVDCLDSYKHAGVPIQQIKDKTDWWLAQDVNVIILAEYRASFIDLKTTYDAYTLVLSIADTFLDGKTIYFNPEKNLPDNIWHALCDESGINV